MNNIIIFNKIQDDGTIVYDYDALYDCVISEDNKIKLVPKIKIIKIKNASEFNIESKLFRGSEITFCKINNKNPTDHKYKSIRDDVYKIINNGTKIIRNTILNIKTTQVEEKGFYYDEELGISIQSADAHKTFREIILQCLSNNISLEIDIIIKEIGKHKYIVE